MKKLLLIIIFIILPISVFAGDNTSILGNPKDTIIPLDQACKQGISNGWNTSGYEQLEFSSNSKYNSVYGFRKMGNFLYFIALEGDYFGENSLLFTPNKSLLYRYDCKKGKMKKIVEIQSQRHPIINIIISISNGYLLIENRAPEANVIDYGILNISTGKIVFLSTFLPPRAGDMSGTIIQDIKSIKFGGINTVRINTYEHGIFEWNFRSNKIIKK